MTFSPVFSEKTPLQKPKLTGPSGIHKLIRDQFSIQAWVSLGALLQAALLLLPIQPTFAVAPATLYILFNIVDMVLVSLKLKRNQHMAGVLSGKFTALVPNLDGTFGKQGDERDGDDKKVAIFLLGFKVNHPLGVFGAPGAVGVTEQYVKMTTDLEANAATNGYLGSKIYLDSSDELPTKSRIMTTFYFRSAEDVQKWAHGPVHRAGWKWFASVSKKHRHLAIDHELFEAPRGKYESIYDNSKPHGFADTRFLVTDKESGQERWISPAVHAEKNSLSGAMGRYRAYD